MNEAVKLKTLDHYTQQVKQMIADYENLSTEEQLDQSNLTALGAKIMFSGETIMHASGADIKENTTIYNRIIDEIASIIVHPIINP